MRSFITKPITPREFLDQWNDIVGSSLFPDRIIKERRPGEILSQWAGDLPKHQERLRHEADALVTRILNIQSDPDIDEMLLATPLDLLAIYYDRVTRAGELLKAAVHLKPEYIGNRYLTWRDLARDLLLGKPVLPGFLCRFDFP